MGLPAKLTIEEQFLLEKFALKKKNKVLLALNKPSNGNHVISSCIKKDLKVEITGVPKDAKEVAKKLLASGQLKIAKSGAEHRSFKRAKLTNEKKFTSPVDTFDKKSETKVFNKEIKARNDFKNFETKSNISDGFSCNKSFVNRVLRVAGFNLTKNILDTAFPPFGQIKSIYFEKEKGCGYVTYETCEMAERAKEELHGTMVQNVTIRVDYARKRPYDDNRNTWRPKRSDLDDPPPIAAPPPAAIPPSAPPTGNFQKKPTVSRLTQASSTKKNTSELKKDCKIEYNEEDFF
ncbi:uncharacterized protein LOC100213995 isoform X1 [Hydra vulgaris]|uniref:uncharacterized protein LOC100213995 isoform X1 n=1 Tax=Hydra vulgaris TaxID=6087 RepID=UPI001F5F0247|nr:uncharacterized protein LOC100213995 [Hydra vulgaris]